MKIPSYVVSFAFGVVFTSAATATAAVAGPSASPGPESVTNLPPGLTPVAALRAPASEPPVRTESQNTPTNGTVSATTRPHTSSLTREIKLTATGAKAEFGRHKAYFASDIGAATPPITIITPGGKTLAFRPTFLVFANRVTRQSTIIGEITNRMGEVVLPDRVVWTNAFEGSGPIVDVEWRYSLNGSEQNLIWRGNPGPSLPEGWQPQDVAIECWTEAFSGPVSVESNTTVLRQETEDVPAVLAPNETINFASMKIVAAGRAFSIGDEQDSVPVAKTWTAVQPETPGADPRHFIIEQVDYLSVKEKLDALPQPARQASGTQHKSSRSELLRLHASLAPAANPIPVVRPSSANAMLVAKASPSSAPGFILDFTIINSVPVPSGIISWWPAGDNALDAITNHNDGTLQNATTYAPGEVGRAFTFNGSGDFVQVADAASLNPTNGLTIEGWVYVTGNQYNHRDIVSKDGEFWDRQFILTDSDQNKFRAHVGLTNGLYYIDGTNTVPLNTWTHFAMTYDKTNLVLYFNGLQEASGAASGRLIVTTQPVRIGGGAPNGTPQYFLAGLVDEPDIFNRALSATEIKAIYDAGAAGKDNANCVAPLTNAVGWWAGDGNAYDLAGTNFGVLQNGAGFTSGVVGQCFTFDGSDQNVEVPDSPDLNPTNITLETWVYVTGNEYNHRDIISKDGEYWDRQYLLTVSDNSTFRAHIGADEGFVCFDGATSVELNTWYHVAMTYDGSDLVLYVDGVQDGSVTLDTGGPVITTSQPVRIGGGAPPETPGYFFAGLIDEPTIYNRALTGTEISAIYSAGCAGKCKVDADHDGLTDLQEAFLGTNPNNPDTDGDGLMDGDEVFVYHLSPLSQDTDGDHVIDQPFKVIITRPKTGSILP